MCASSTIIYLILAIFVVFLPLTKLAFCDILFRYFMEFLKQFFFGMQIGAAIIGSLIFIIFGLSALLVFAGPYFRIVGSFLLLIGTANLIAASARHFIKRYEF